MKPLCAILAACLLAGCASNPVKVATPAPLPPMVPQARLASVVRPPATNAVPPPDHFTISIAPPHVFTLVCSHDLRAWSRVTNGPGPFTVTNDSSAAYFRAVVTNEVELGWDASTNPSVSATAVYTGLRSRSYSSRQTTTNNSFISAVYAGTNYFAVAYLYADGSEGPLSDELPWFTSQSTLGIK